jgi:hypothetical protein
MTLRSNAENGDDDDVGGDDVGGRIFLFRGSEAVEETRRVALSNWAVNDVTTRYRACLTRYHVTTISINGNPSQPQLPKGAASSLAK